MDFLNKPDKNIKNLIVASAVNGSIMCICMMMTNMTYESGDDYFISELIKNGYPYAGFVNYYLCRLLIAIQAHVSVLNVYVLFLIGVSFVSFTCFTKMILDKCSSAATCLLVVAVIFVYSFDHYGSIQFTKTAALAVTAGFIALAHCVTEHKGAVGCAASIALIYTGAAIRYDAFTASYGIAAASLLTWIFLERKRIKEEGRFGAKKLAATAVIILIVTGAYGVIHLSDMKNESTPELKYAAEYTLYRSNVTDYPTYKYFDQNKEYFDAIGISKNDLFMIENFRFDYDGAASLENLKLIDAIERPKGTMSERIRDSFRDAVRHVITNIKYRSSTGVHVVILTMLAAGMIVSLKPKHWIYVIVMGGVTFGLYCALFYVSRVNYRATYVADIGTSLWLLYYYASYAGGSDELRPKASIACGLLILIISLASGQALANLVETKYERLADRTLSEEGAAYIAGHSDEVFVWGTGERRHAKQYSKPWLAPDDSDRNSFDTGGWETNYPYILDKLAACGMQNPIKDLIDNEYAYYVGNRYIKELEEYYTKWYGGDGEKVILTKTGEIDGVSMWKVEKK